MTKKRGAKEVLPPKRPTSAFFFYQAERRPTIKTEKPDLQNKEIISVSASLTLRQWPLNGEALRMILSRSIGTWRSLTRIGMLQIRSSMISI